MSGKAEQDINREIFGFYYNDIESDVRINSNKDVYDEESGGAVGIESRLFYYVRTGNFFQLKALLESDEYTDLLFPPRYRKNTVRFLLRASELMTLSGIAAVQGGLSNDTRYSLLGSHIDNLESCHEAGQIYAAVTRCIYEFAFLTNGISGYTAKGYSPLVNKCIACIMEHMPGKLSLSELAEILHVTPKYLSTLFNRDTGMSIPDFMQDMRIEEAKNMLMYTDLNYPEISNLLCFGSQSYFNQVFRKKTGMTPKEFRTVRKED